MITASFNGLYSKLSYSEFMSEFHRDIERAINNPELRSYVDKKRTDSKPELLH